MRSGADSIFVAGGTGYIGRPLIENLVARGFSVDALVREGSHARLASGARPIVVGLPSALTVEDTPEYLVRDRFTPGASEAVADHARYLEAAREAAVAAGAEFVDAAAAMGGDPRLFTRDRIHLSAEGHEALADLVAAEIP